MTALAAHIPALVVVNLLMCSYIMPVLARWRKHLCIPVALGSVGLSFIFSIFLTFRVSREGSFSYSLGGWAAPWGIEFVVDHFSVFMLLTLTGVGLLILVYATKDLNHELKPDVMGWYYTLYLLLMASMVGLASRSSTNFPSPTSAASAASITCHSRSRSSVSRLAGLDSRASTRSGGSTSRAERERGRRR